MSDRLMSTRIEPLKRYDQLVKVCRHDLRQTKPTHHNGNINPVWASNRIGKMPGISHYGFRSEQNMDYIQDIVNTFEANQSIHSSKYYQSKGRGIDRSRVASWGSGVVSFSDDINDIYQQDPEGFMEFSVDAIRDVCKSVGIKYDPYYITVHHDEKTVKNKKAKVHIHFLVDNYDADGNSFGFDQNRNGIGSRLQDLMSDKFKRYGFKRGLEAQHTGAKHLKPHEYALYQKALEDNQRLKDENTALNIKNTKALAKLEEYRQREEQFRERAVLHTEAIKSLKKNEQMGVSVMEDMINQFTEVMKEAIELGDGRGTPAKMINKFMGFADKEQTKKMAMLLEVWTNKLTQIKKKPKRSKSKPNTIRRL